MKWFFAYNNLNPDVYDLHIRIMIRSALANTSLEPHMVYCGRDDSPLVAFAEENGVKVIHHTANVWASLRRIKTKFPDYDLKSASGSYLRLDVPLLCRKLGYTDDFVLYTDCDVVFARDIPPASSAEYLRPTIFACAGEHLRDNSDEVNMNTGVMVMNVEQLQRDYLAFKEYVTSDDLLYHEFFRNGPHDQAAYHSYYRSRWDKLPDEYNWKPYWGYNEEARIVHFHGAKIQHVREIINGNTDGIRDRFIWLYEHDPDGYREYLEFAERYAA